MSAALHVSEAPEQTFEVSLRPLLILECRTCRSLTIISLTAGNYDRLPSSVRNP